MIPFIDFDNDFIDTEALLFFQMAAGGAAVEATATGNPLTFLTDIAKPLKSLVIPFSDENGVTGLSVWHGGKNLFDKTNGTEGFVWWEGQRVVGYNDFFASIKIPVVPGAKYTLKKDVTGQNQCELFDINGNFVSQSTNMMGLSVSTFIIPDGVYFIAFNINKAALDTAQLEVGQTASTYEEYKPITEHNVIFPVEAGTPTAGQLDIISGILTVTAPTAGTYQLTGEQFTAIVGDNTIWSDADGSMTAVYLKKG